MADKSNDILAKVLTLNPAELSLFMTGLSPDLLNYLEILLSKAENDTTRLKRHLDRGKVEPG